VIGPGLSREQHVEAVAEGEEIVDDAVGRDLRIAAAARPDRVQLLLLASVNGC